jgi:ceramide glucosyltransferase
VILNWIFGVLAVLSFALQLWQWLAARRFPLHQRAAKLDFAPPVTLLKPVKGGDAATENCLRSWLTQNYSGQIQILFGVAAPDDPACEIIRKLIGEFPALDTQLVVCGPLPGANAKVAKLAQLQKLARHELLVISDADVRVPPDFLANAVAPLAKSETGLVNCFYRLANPTTLAMRWEAVAINADFWSQVLQSQTLKPLDFALGAAMVTRRNNLEEIGGFDSLVNVLADDYQLGHRIAQKGHAIELCPVVVECWDPPQTWKSVWKHQLRWARTIRVCQPAPYFFSILSNLTFWTLAWLAVVPSGISAGFFSACLFIRMIIVENLQRRLTKAPPGLTCGLAPLKDLLQAAIWFFAFAGNTIEWRGQKFVLRRDGTLLKK